MTANPLLEYRPLEGDRRELLEDERAIIDEDWQGGVENLGFLFQLGDVVELSKLDAELAGFITSLGGGDPPSSLARSSHHDANLSLLRKKDPGLLLDELGALIGEAAVELGWQWGHDGVAPFVRAEDGETLQPFLFVQALLEGRAAVVTIGDVFDALRGSR